MEILASDLDNTLVFSPRRNIIGEKICVEIYKNQENSYMTIETIELMKKIQKKILFVPVTTRSDEGYLRINFSEIGSPKYALTCNGGVLLVNGEIDKDWYNSTLNIIKSSKPVINQAVNILENDTNLIQDVRYVRELFLFTKSNEPTKTIQNLEKQLDMCLVDVYSQGVKIYVLPKNLNKGTAITRLKEKFKPTTVFTSGDTLFDVPMLMLGDKSYYPETLESKELENNSNAMKIYKTNGDFSDVFLKNILNTIK